MDNVHTIIVELPKDLVQRVDEYRYEKRKPSRKAAIQELLERALTTQKGPKK